MPQKSSLSLFIIVFVFIMFITFIMIIAILMSLRHVHERSLLSLQSDERIVMNMMMSSHMILLTCRLLKDT
jgi:hypothetical protein